MKNTQVKLILFFYILVIGIFSLIIVWKYFGVHMDFNQINTSVNYLKQFKLQHPFELTLLLINISLIIQGCSLPGGSIINTLIAILYNLPFNLILICVLSAFGSVLSLIFIRYFCMGFVDFLFPKYKKLFQNYIEDYKESPILLIILLRCFPLIPHILVNFLCATCNITLKQMFIGTLIGGIPHAICYVLFGSELSLYLSIGSIFNIKSFLILSTGFIITLIPFLLKHKVINKSLISKC